MSSAYPPYNGIPSKPCPRCGVALSIHDTRCNNCGYYYAPTPDSMQMNGQPASQPWSNIPPMMPFSSPSGQGSNQQWGQIPTTPPLQNGYGQTPPAIPATPPLYGSGPMQPLNGYPPQSPTTGNYYGQAQQPVQQPMGYYNSSSPQAPLYAPSPMANGFNNFQAGGMNGTPPLGNGQPSRGKRGPNVGVIVGVVVLLLMLIGGGIAGYSFLKVPKQNTATGTPQTAPTANATAAPKGQPLFADTFKDNGKQWNLVSEQGKFSAAIRNNSLILEDDDNKLLWEMVPGSVTFSDFNLYVDATLSKGEQNNGYGIYIRGALGQNNDLTTYYRFELYGDGTFAIFKGSVDGNGNLNSTRIVDYTQSPAIQKRGGVNHIEIAAKGSTMKLLVNGQILKTINDGSYASGSVALFVSNLQGSQPIAQATFANFALYPPQS